jgi:hypothetical protein
MKKLIVILAIFSTLAFAKSTVEVLGTSTVHDWKMVTNSIAVDMVQNNGKFTKLDVSFIAKTLKSGDEGLDDTAYESMEVDDESTVSFSLSEQKDDKTIVGTVSFLEKELSVTNMPTLSEAGHISGSFNVKMTDFGIVPPTFLFGAMSAGDDLTIKYDITKP